MELYKLTAHELIKKLKNKETSSQEILSSLIIRIKDADPSVKGYVRRKDWQESKIPENGVPISIKDNICTEGINTECCSKILQGFKPPYDATVVKKLKEKGVTALGLKT